MGSGGVEEGGGAARASAHTQGLAYHRSCLLRASTICTDCGVALNAYLLQKSCSDPHHVP